MEDGLMGDDQFDFDGASKGADGSDAGFGAGWEDDLETMLLKGMKKKAQRRIAMMASMGVLMLMLGSLWGYGAAMATRDDPTTGASYSDGPVGCTGADCRPCTPMVKGGDDYLGWSPACSGSRCEGCLEESGDCPHNCVCMVTCTCTPHIRYEMNEQILGQDGLYLVTCVDGAWVGEEDCSPGSSCTDSAGQTTSLCLPYDDCASSPCQHGGVCTACSNDETGANYTCNCAKDTRSDQPLFQKSEDETEPGNCEYDIDQCAGNPNPCYIVTSDGLRGSVRCYDSGRMHWFDGQNFQSTQGFLQPPPGYPQYHPHTGMFGEGPTASPFVCVCSSTNQTLATYTAEEAWTTTEEAWNTRNTYGQYCTDQYDHCANSPCENCGDVDCCVSSNYDYTCDCQPGWEGTNCAIAKSPPPPPPNATTVRAVATFNQEGVTGTITMSQDVANSSAPTTVHVHLVGLRFGPNPWHVHSKPVREPGNCSRGSTGDHFIPDSQIWNLGNAMSELGAEASIDASSGEVNMNAIDATLPLSGPQSVIGRSIVIHKNSKHNSERWICATIVNVDNATSSNTCGDMKGTWFSASAVSDRYTFSEGCSGALGAQCTVGCKPGFREEGSSRYTCTGGAWEDDTPHRDTPAVSCADIDECQSDPCVNGGTCTDSTTDDTYACACVDGYHGYNCNTDTDDCECMPCQNGGACTDRIDAYVCVCTPGFDGDDCEQDIDECLSTPCQNGGACADSHTDQHLVPPGEFLCDCHGTGFNGTLCDSSQNFCSSNPCANGGTCTTSRGGYHCDCAAGYTGDLGNCEVDVDECASGPCQNKAHCVQAIDAYSCNCAQGFTGTNCDASVATNNCDSSPCQNAGDCDPAATAYTCTCADGFVGDHCETADPCRPTNSCHNGTCDGSTGTVVCHCSLGWFGDACDEETDECGSNPCENGATCNDGDLAYTCSCAEGYAGDNCDGAACTPNTCSGHGSCSAGDDGAAACSCVGDYYGDHCESATDNCAESPCSNGGTCRDGVNEFTCDCAEGYGGSTCQCGPSQLADDQCTVCVSGKHPNEHKSQCRDCDPGYYGSNGTCTKCAPGKKAAPPPSTSCDDCTGAEYGTDGTCTLCDAGRHPAGNHQSCAGCSSGYRAADDTSGSCTPCGVGQQPDGARAECVDCPNGKAGSTGTCARCPAGRQGAPENLIECVTCGADAASYGAGTACVVCDDGKVATSDHTDCVDPDDGECELTNAPMCLVLNSVALTSAVPGKHLNFNDAAANELTDGLVTDSTNDYIYNLLPGPCTDAGCGTDGDGGIVVTSTGSHPTSFTVEFAVDSADACEGLIDLFTSELADPTSTLMTCAGGGLSPCWSLDANQTLDTNCIGGR